MHVNELITKKKDRRSPQKTILDSGSVQTLQDLKGTPSSVHSQLPGTWFFYPISPRGEMTNIGGCQFLKVVPEENFLSLAFWVTMLSIVEGSVLMLIINTK
jgi:hypothetical protein